MKEPGGFEVPGFFCLLTQSSQRTRSFLGIGRFSGAGAVGFSHEVHESWPQWGVAKEGTESTEGFGEWRGVNNNEYAQDGELYSGCKM